MRRDYPNGFLRALRHAARRSELEAELLDAADEIERLRAEIERLRQPATAERLHREIREEIENP